MQEEKISNEELKKLVEKAKNGDSKAFGLLYTMYLTPLYRFIYFRIKHEPDTEDLTQVVFTKAWQALGKYEDQGVPFSAWLYRIARNTITDYWKKKKDVLFDDPQSVDVEDRSDKQLMESIDKKKLFEIVQQEIDTMSEDQQEILLLKFMSELENEEIEIITRKTQEAIRAVQYRALKTIRERLKNQHTDHQV